MSLAFSILISSVVIGISLLIATIILSKKGEIANKEKIKKAIKKPLFFVPIALILLGATGHFISKKYGKYEEHKMHQRSNLDLGHFKIFGYKGLKLRANMQEVIYIYGYPDKIKLGRNDEIVEYTNQKLDGSWRWIYHGQTSIVVVFRLSEHDEGNQVIRIGIYHNDGDFDFSRIDGNDLMISDKSGELIQNPHGALFHGLTTYDKMQSLYGPPKLLRKIKENASEAFYEKLGVSFMYLNRRVIRLDICYRPYPIELMDL
ncbi:MAG: hypothetical protein H7A51_05105 [Akkermansiaceae bacterium]|nr:hypothetical protein [Akkermansiaceae bacterium]